MPDENDGVTVADETDQRGLPITCFHGALPEATRRSIAHGLDLMDGAEHASDTRRIP